SISASGGCSAHSLTGHCHSNCAGGAGCLPSCAPHTHTHTHTYTPTPTHTHCDDGTDAAPVLFIFCRGFIWRCVRTPNESSSPQTNQQLGPRSSANQQFTQI